MSGGYKKLDAAKKKRIITLLQGIGDKVKKVVFDELQDDIEELSSIFNAVPNFDVDIQTKNELLDSISHTKSVFGETSHFLNLLENYFETLSQETGKQQLSKNHQYDETLFEFTKFIVEQTAKRNEERRSKVFHQIYSRQSSKAKQSAAFSRNNRPNNHGLGHPISRTSLVEVERCVPSVCSVSRKKPAPQAKNQSAVHLMNTLVAKTSISGQEHPNGVQAMTKGYNHHGKENEARKLEALGGGDALVTSKDWSDLPSTSMQSSDLSISSQQDNSSVSLSTPPPTTAAPTVNRNYKLLLLTLAQRLLSSEIVNLTDWAAQNFSIVNVQNATDVLFQLDKKQVINAADLSRLHEFFESIIRFDLVWIIDAFLIGDYSLLGNTASSKRRNTNDVQNLGHGSTSRNINQEPPLNHSAPTGISKASKYRNSVMKQENSCGTQNFVHLQTQEKSERRDAVGTQGLQPTSNQFSTKSKAILQVNDSGKITPANLVPQQTLQITSRNFSEELNSNVRREIANEYQSTVHEEQNQTPTETGISTNTTADVDTACRPRLSESLTNSARNTQSSSNISTPSTLQPSDTEQTVSHFQSSRASLNQHLPREYNWSCSHYKRVGMVKFDCCETFWPCHHCHNNKRTCGQSKRESHNAVLVKCVHCNTEQQFCQTCSCGSKFANYYCKRCKHLTGKDNFPYHCEKCETCRIHGDRSFHCDACGLCFHKDYRAYHIHDKCCICLQDAFTRCPILPCSHKFHKECINQETIHRRFIQCKICGQSFPSNYLTRSL